jgi:hypothetical protein
MSNEQTGARDSHAGAGARKRPRQESPAADMKQTMAEMMANCHCGPDMVRKMVRVMGRCGPSTPGKPAQEKTAPSRRSDGAGDRD